MGERFKRLDGAVFLCVFNLAIDVLSRFMLWILWDDAEEPFKQWRQVKRSRFNFAERSRNPVSQACRPPVTQAVSEDVFCLRAGKNCKRDTQQRLAYKGQEKQND